MPVQLEERSEAARLAADDRERQRQTETPCTLDRLGMPADRDPYRQRVLQGAGQHGLSVERRAMSPAPRDTHVVPDLKEQLELLLEERVVVLEVVAEERERLDERASPRHDLGPAAGEEVDGREVLEHADRVVGAEHRDRAREADPLGARRGRREDDRRSRHRELLAVVLPETENVETDP